MQRMYSFRESQLSDILRIRCRCFWCKGAGGVHGVAELRTLPEAIGLPFCGLLLGQEKQKSGDVMTDPESAKEAAKAVEKVAQVAPEVYKDVFQPSAQEVGKGLLTVTKTMLIALAPLKALVWGYEQFEEFFATKVAEKLSQTPPEEIIEPKLHIAGPALEALRFTGHEDSLSNLYANLLAT